MIFRPLRTICAGNNTMACRKRRNSIRTNSRPRCRLGISNPYQDLRFHARALMQASLAGFWVPWYDILLFFLRVGLTKIWELGTDPIAIRGSAVLEGPV